jgi:hypothetical protein
MQQKSHAFGAKYYEISCVFFQHEIRTLKQNGSWKNTTENCAEEEIFGTYHRGSKIDNKNN